MGLPLALTPGTMIDGHYIIGDLINSGGFGAVYRGIDTSEGNRPCAIKETYDVTPAARRQALMEASVLFTVRSKHLPEVYDALEANGRFYLVMQLIEGQNLLQVLRSRVPDGLLGEQEPNTQSQGPCTERDVIGWLLPIMDVLADLHSRHPPIMHRDIKPGNIILTPSQTAVLVDFGLTRLYDPQSTTQTLVKAVSEGFSPIEQYVGKTSPQSDIYSLAATIYLLLTNRILPMALSRATQDKLIPPRLLNPSLSLHVERALLKALAVQADQRYRDMREFMHALQSSGSSAHTNYTIAASPAGFNSQPAQQSLRLPPPPPQSYPISPARNSPLSAPPVGWPPGGGAGQYSAYPVPRPTMAPQSAMVPQALPTPFGQGCLWGLIQGVLSGLLVAFTINQANFYLTIFIGLMFYVIAGFMTTRKGGGAGRGAWAGFWAGFHSTIIFWITFGVCIVIRLVQVLQSFNVDPNDPNKALSRAWHFVLRYTALPHELTVGATQPPWGGLAIVLGGGLTLAILLGLFGGLLGNARYKEKMKQ